MIPGSAVGCITDWATGPCMYNRTFKHYCTSLNGRTSVLARGYKTFFMLNSTEHKFQLLIELKYRQMKKFLAFSLSDDVFIMLINVKMPTIVGILTFMSRINFMLS